MSQIEISQFADAHKSLCIHDLKQALYDAGAVLMQDVLVTLHGQPHRARRMLEMRIFKRDFFRYYESEVFPQVLADTLQPHLERGGMDLMDFGRWSMIDLTAHFAGIDRTDNDLAETEDLVRLLKVFGEGATLAHYTGDDREAVVARVQAGLDEFDSRFFAPSAARRKAMIAAFENGEMEEDALPRDILTVLLRNEDKLDLPHDLMLREVAFFYLAGAHTSIHSLSWAMHETFTWCESHPEDWTKVASDPIFVQRCINESFRLHPSSPVAMRQPVCPVHMPDGAEAVEGDKVIINLWEANRDPEVYGDDAAMFNPYRKLPAGQSPYGLTFGIGVHACLGKNLAAGEPPKDDTDPDTHQYGTVALIARALFEHGVRPDPDQPAQRDTTTARETWATYPVVFTSLKHD